MSDIKVEVTRDDDGKSKIKVVVNRRIVEISASDAMRVGCELVRAGTNVVCEDVGRELESAKRRESMQ